MHKVVMYMYMYVRVCGIVEEDIVHVLWSVRDILYTVYLFCS